MKNYLYQYCSLSLWWKHLLIRRKLTKFPVKNNENETERKLRKLAGQLSCDLSHLFFFFLIQFYSLRGRLVLTNSKERILLRLSYLLWHRLVEHLWICEARKGDWDVSCSAEMSRFFFLSRFPFILFSNIPKLVCFFFFSF